MPLKTFSKKTGAFLSFCMAQFLSLVVLILVITSYWVVFLSTSPLSPTQLYNIVANDLNSFIIAESGLNLTPTNGTLHWHKKAHKFVLILNETTIEGSVNGQAQQLTANLRYGLTHLPKLTYIGIENADLHIYDKDNSQRSTMSLDDLPQLGLKNITIHYKDHTALINKAATRNNDGFEFSVTGTLKSADLAVNLISNGFVNRKNQLSAYIETTESKAYKQSLPPLKFSVASNLLLPSTKPQTHITLHAPIEGHVDILERQVTATLPTITITQLKQHFDSSLKNITNAITTGQLNNTALTFNYKTPQQYALKTQLQNATIYFGEKQKPITGFNGSLTAENNIYNIRGNGSLANGKLTLTKARIDGKNQTIEAVLASPLQQQLQLALKDPAIQKQLKSLQTDQITGQATTYLTLNNKDITLKSDWQNVTLPIPNTSYTLKNITGTLKVNQNKPVFAGIGTFNQIPISLNFTTEKSVLKTSTLQDVQQLLNIIGVTDLQQNITGKATLEVAYANALKATVDLTDTTITIPELNWQKPSGQTATLTINGKAKNSYDLTLKTQQDTINANLKDKLLIVTNSQFGQNIIDKLQLNTATKALKVRARKLDLSKLSAGNNTSPYTFKGTADKILLPKEMVITNVIFEKAAILSVNAKLSNSPITLTKRAETIELTTPDAAGFLKAMGITEHMLGGTLYFRGDTNLKGLLKVEDFRLVKMPLLAKILSAGSITGPLEVLSGRGIAFQKFSGDILYTDKVLTLSEARLVGTGLGLHTEGTIDIGQNRVNLNGTIVPFNRINSAAKNIPILGEILTGSNGAGIIALTYRARGKLNDPDVSINPLSALTPGFLRRIFE